MNPERAWREVNERLNEREVLARSHNDAILRDALNRLDGLPPSDVPRRKFSVDNGKTWHVSKEEAEAYAEVQAKWEKAEARRHNAAVFYVVQREEMARPTSDFAVPNRVTVALGAGEEVRPLRTFRSLNPPRPKTDSPVWFVVAFVVAFVAAILIGPEAASVAAVVTGLIAGVLLARPIYFPLKPPELPRARPPFWDEAWAEVEDIDRLHGLDDCDLTTTKET